MDLGIEGRTAVVCASSRGLGKGCAEALAKAGCRLVINARNEASLEEAASDLRRLGADVTTVAADISSREGQERVLAAAKAVDILINNNGGPPRRGFRELTRDDMLKGVTQNMVTPIELIQAVADGMVERGFGRIVNITSLSVLMPIPGLDLSSGARAGLTAFLAGVCREFASHNVTVNNILPGKMDTDRLRAGLSWQAKKAGISEDEAAKREAAAIPAGRFGTPEEFGQLAAFLCSANAGYITGQNFRVDGGLLPTAF
ncbi:3-oxoacyl-[acyl-carrier protein] reductase [Rhodopseudomonas julia]|uniref:3-oxoacyl-[acyl-carrier protein] reductase n=1 Tax=Rhodopseudomonas julia TaxID=200617 RepID=A0ABU0C8C9_9BRAD|nr:SDR family oxidoreductase [Rhodopseudomonas julia]MDQ0326776.1 3-oxoacyl-[acyl-carrier protein] reductase [Rhodopseudomonas julia]